MKVFRILFGTLWISAAASIVFAQPVPPVLSQTTVTNGEFRFNISGTTASNVVVQTATNTSNGILSWTNVAPASSSFSVPIQQDGIPHHFRVRCEDGGVIYSVNMVSYFHVQPTAGFSMLGFPLESTNNTLSNILPLVSEGTLLHWFDPFVQRLETAQFEFGRWSHPNVPVPRGRAVLLWSPSQAVSFVLHGSFSGGRSSNYLGSGFNLLSPVWPTDGTLPTEGCADRGALELIGTDGIDPVYRPYYEVTALWFDDQQNIKDPPFPPFGGLWLWRPCPPHLVIQDRTFPVLASDGANNGDGGGASASPSASAGVGAVYFNNYVPGFKIDARIVHTNGEVPSGTNWLAQLYGGAPGDAENDLVASGDPLSFLNGVEAGYIDTTAGATRILTNAAETGDSLGQIRFWDVRTGATWEAATTRGRTTVFRIPTRFPGVTPSAPMLGLMSPHLTISRDMLPAAIRLTVQGCTGMVYSVGSSMTCSNWTTIGTVTNAASQSSCVDAGANTNQQRFYRATILGPSI